MQMQRKTHNTHTHRNVATNRHEQRLYVGIRNLGSAHHQGGLTRICGGPMGFHGSSGGAHGSPRAKGPPGSSRGGAWVPKGSP